MATTTIGAMKQGADDATLVRKVLEAVMFIAPKDVSLPAAITEGDTVTPALSEVPAGFLPVGLVTPEGYSVSREVEKDGIEALGYASEVRIDTMSVERQITFTPLESFKRHMLELKYGMDLSDVDPDTDTSEIVFDEPSLPFDDQWRVLLIGVDGPADSQWIMGMGFPNAQFDSSAEEAWAREGAKANALTIKILDDPEEGTAVRHYIGGTGAKKKIADIWPA